MAPKSQIHCKTRRIYPVRYALTSEPTPPIKNQKHFCNFHYEGPEVADYELTLRSLRDGFIHIYLPETNKAISFTRSDCGFAPAENASKKEWIEVPYEAQKLYIAFSPVQWTKKRWAEVKVEGFTRMQEIELSDGGTGKHTGLSQPCTPLVVEEHRFDRGGWLESMREKLTKIFDPTPQVSNILPAEKKIQKAERWKHSGVSFFLPDPKAPKKADGPEKMLYGCVPKPKQGITNWTNEHPSFMAEDSCFPLLIAVYDAVGVGQDLATLHAADLEAMDAFHNWYAHPVISGKHLGDMKKALRKQSQDISYKNSGWLGYLNLKGFMGKQQIQAVLSRFPKTNWENFLQFYNEYGVSINAHMLQFCTSWKAWLLADEIKAGSFREALADFDEGQEAELEETFARTHFLIGSSEFGLNMATEIYLNKEASSDEGALYSPPVPLFQILSGNSQNGTLPVTDDTILVAASFITAIAGLAKGDPYGGDRVNWLNCIHSRLAGHAENITPFETSIGACLKAIAENDHDFEEVAKVVPQYDVEEKRAFTAAISAYNNKMNLGIAELIGIKKTDTYKPQPIKLARLANGLLLHYAFIEAANSLSADKPTSQKVEAAIGFISASMDIFFMHTITVWRAWFPATTMFAFGVIALATKSFRAVSTGRADLVGLAAVSAVANTGAFFCMLRAARGVPKCNWIGAACFAVAFFADLLFDARDETPIDKWMNECAWANKNWRFDFSYAEKRFEHTETSDERLAMAKDLHRLYSWLCEPKTSWGRARSSEGDELLMLDTSVNYFDLNSSRIVTTYYMTPTDDIKNAAYLKNNGYNLSAHLFDRYSKHLLHGTGPCRCVLSIPVDNFREHLAGFYSEYPEYCDRMYLVSHSTFTDFRTGKQLVESIKVLESISYLVGPARYILSLFSEVY